MGRFGSGERRFELAGPVWLFAQYSDPWTQSGRGADREDPDWRDIAPKRSAAHGLTFSAVHV